MSFVISLCGLDGNGMKVALSSGMEKSIPVHKTDLATFEQAVRVLWEDLMADAAVGRVDGVDPEDIPDYLRPK